MTGTAAPGPPGPRAAPAALALAGILAAYLAATLTASARTSLTFDEITLMAGGARALSTGRIDLVPDHPPLMQYLYGAAARLAGLPAPADPGDASVSAFRYEYARRVLFESGADPVRVAFAVRVIPCACACALIALVFLYARPRCGNGGALVAATLAAFLPDMLAHGGVAYNDLPLALLYFAGAWAAEGAARTAGARRGLLVGALLALAAGVKFSGVALLPVLLAHLALEARSRLREPLWRAAALRCLLAAAATAWVGTALLYGGDLLLATPRGGLATQLSRLAEGHVAPAYLLGRTNPAGWWYFFPVAFLFKTPLAFQAILVLAAAGAALGRRPAPEEGGRWRAAWLASLLYLAVLLSSRLNTSFRHALPLLPWLCALAAGGLSRLTPARLRFARPFAAALLAWHVVGSLSWHPHFLAYTSEYIRTRDGGHRVLLDSSLDWGQGLLELRDHMRRRGIPRVALGYFGSALPEAYGIDYYPLPSFLHLPPRPEPAGAPPPDRVVISATLLHGLYVEGDPFRAFREAVPEAVLAHTLFVFRASAVPVLPAAAAARDAAPR